MPCKVLFPSQDASLSTFLPPVNELSLFSQGDIRNLRGLATITLIFGSSRLRRKRYAQMLESEAKRSQSLAVFETSLTDPLLDLFEA